MKNSRIILFLMLITIGIIYVIFEQDPQKQQKNGGIITNSNRSHVSQYAKDSDLPLYISTPTKNRSNSYNQITNKQLYVTRHNMSSEMSLLKVDNRNPEYHKGMIASGGMSNNNKSYGITGRPSSLTTPTGISMPNISVNLLYADSKEKINTFTDDEIIETGNRKKVNLHDDPSWLNPWEKAPIGDALFPMILLASVWIFITYKKNNL